MFCPEYAGTRPLEISPADWDTQIFLFGPGMLPDSDLPPGRSWFLPAAALRDL